MSERKKVILNKRDTAFVLGVSIVTLNNWDIAPFKKTGRIIFYNLKDVIAYWRNKEKKRETPLTDERTRLTRIQADKAEREFELLKNKLHDSDIVKSVWSDIVLRFRSRLLAVPAKLSLGLCNKTEPNKIESIIQKEVLQVLEELQKYKASDYSITDDNLLSDDLENELQIIPKKVVKKKSTVKKTTKKTAKKKRTLKKVVKKKAVRKKK